ncbi:MAG: response regulator transcription factor [Lysobacteraceae bacterium]
MNDPARPAPRIALVEDDIDTRRAVLNRLFSERDIHLAFEAGSIAQARQCWEELDFDVLLVDLGLPDGSGLDLISEARQRFPSALIMVLSVFGDEQKLIAAIERGAKGYLLKDETSIGLTQAIDDLWAGGSPISPAIARHLVRRLARVDPVPGARTDNAAINNMLTGREREVLQLSAKGFNHAEVALLLGLSKNTIASYTRTIYEKLEVHSRQEALFEADRLGLLSPTN